MSGGDALRLVVEYVHGRPVGKSRKRRVRSERRANHRAVGAPAHALDIAPDVLEYRLSRSREDIGKAVEHDSSRGIQDGPGDVLVSGVCNEPRDSLRGIHV